MRTKDEMLREMIGADSYERAKYRAAQLNVELLADIRDLLAARFGEERMRVENIGEALGEIKKNEMDGE